MVKYLSRILGVVFLFVGLGIFSYAGIKHFKSVKDSKDILSESTIYTRGESTGLSPDSLATESGIDSIEILTSDMKVKEVKSLKNCMSIPNLSIKVPIVEGTDSYSLSLGAGHFTGTAKIGGKGNACFAGHYSTIYNCIFNNLPDIELYDKIYLYNSKGTKFEYYVINKYITEPTDLSVLNQDSFGKYMTIVTCAESGTKRMIVKAKCLTKSELKEEREEFRRLRLESIDGCVDNLGTVEVLSYMKHKTRSLRSRFRNKVEIEAVSGGAINEIGGNKYEDWYK